MSRVTAEQAIQVALEHHRRGESARAESIYRQVLQQQPKNHDAMQLLGALAFQAGQFATAVELIEQAVAIAPGHVHYHANLGKALIRAGRPRDGEAALRRAIRIDPKHAEAHFELGQLFMNEGKWPESADCFRAALWLRGDDASALNNLGHVLQSAGHAQDAADAYRQAIRHRAGFTEAHANLGGLLLEMGEVADGIEHLRRAVELSPNYPAVHGTLLYALHLDPSLSPEAVFAEHLEWARRHAEPLKSQIRPHDNGRDPDRRLKVGYVSQDFRDHPVGRFILPILAAHDRTRLEVHLFSDVFLADELTATLRGHADRWHDVQKLDFAALAEAIRAEAIDVLVDLSGHVGVARPLVFALKPAPVQVTYLGYPDTTGLSTMDWRITDAQADPEGQTERFHTEQLVRLEGGFLCYRPADDVPDVASPPCIKSGRVTFGSFNNLAKVSADAVALWARILRHLPNARMLIKSRMINDESIRRRIRRSFAALGVDSRRLDLRGRESSHASHLAMYADVDVALDTFPYNGTTTTLDALTMGVPVVALAGRTHASRVGVSILTHAGLGDWVARDGDEYVSRAVALAGDVGRLETLRRTLRGRVLGSPLGDATGMARNLEAAYRQMWTTSCGAAVPSSQGADEKT